MEMQSEQMEPINDSKESQVSMVTKDACQRQNSIKEKDDIQDHNISADKPTHDTETSNQFGNILDLRTEGEISDEEISCSICDFVSNNKKNLIKHMDYHNIALKCWFCHAKFSTAIFLTKHVLQCVNRGIVRDCSYCGKKFFDREELMAHEYHKHLIIGDTREANCTGIAGSGVVGTLKCPVCLNKSETHDDMQKHLVEHLNATINQEQLQCELCEVRASNQLSLRQHVTSSRHKEMISRLKCLFRCNHCDFVFVSRDSFAMHKLDIARQQSQNALARRGILVSDESDDQISESPTESTPVSPIPDTRMPAFKLDATEIIPLQIKEEQRDDYEYGISPLETQANKAEEIDVKPDITKLKLAMERESSRSQTTDENGSNFHGNISQYACNVCGAVQPDQDAFAMHMLQHAREAPEPVQEGPSDLSWIYSLQSQKKESRQSRQIECLSCGERFVSRDGLAMHVMSFHVNVEDADKDESAALQMLLDSLFGRSTLFRGNASRMHERAQFRQLVDTFKCTYCSASFNDRDSLAMHTISHLHSEPTTSSEARRRSSDLNHQNSSSNPSSPKNYPFMHGWRKKILRAIYGDNRDATNNNNSQDEAQPSHRQSRSRSRDTDVSTSDSEHSNRYRLLNQSPNRVVPIWDQNTAFSDDRVVVCDKTGEKWACLACGVEFRSVVSITRHLGHVSHKLEVEKKLRQNMLSPDFSSKLHRKVEHTSDADDVSEHGASICSHCGIAFVDKDAYHSHLESVGIRVANTNSSEIFNGAAGNESERKRSHDEASIQTPGSRRKRPKTDRCDPNENLAFDDSDIDTSSEVSHVSKYSTNTALEILQRKKQQEGLGHNGNENKNDEKDNESVSSSEIIGKSEILEYLIKQNNLYLCKYCRVTFCDRTQYCLHMGLHNLNDPWQCNLCGKVCNDVHQFSSHVMHFN